MSAVSPEVTTEAGRPLLAPPVTAGPITASSLGGVPFIAVAGPVAHFSGRRLTQYVMAALGELDLTIDLP